MTTNKKNIGVISLSLTMCILAIIGCSKGSDSPAGGSGQSYSFTSAASATIQSAVPFIGQKNSVSTLASSNPTLCSSVICITPTEVSGIYYGTGLSIQSNGSGMMAYFGQDAWSGITGASPSFPFSSSSPIVNSGTINCCVGTGDLTSDSTHIESVAYLFGYLDVTFTLSGITGNVGMNGTYEVRFVLADDAITSGVRGDLLIKDSGVFKWMNSTNDALSTTRPSAPVTMNTSVVNWVNPFGTDKGNQEIPVLGALVATPADTRMSITETELRSTTNTYTFGFNRNNLIMFPSLLHADLNMISSLRELLNRIHLASLPHSLQPMGVGSMADTELTITP
jgi:hypothetical protein